MFTGLSMGSYAFQLACDDVKTLLYLEESFQRTMTGHLPPLHHAILHFPRFLISKRINGVRGIRLLRVLLCVHVVVDLDIWGAGVGELLGSHVELLIG